MDHRDTLTPVSRDNPLHLYHPRGYSAVLPVTVDRCAACRFPVDLDNEAAYYVSRVNGNSEYGYEPTHYVCDGPTVSIVVYVSECDVKPVMTGLSYSEALKHLRRYFRANPGKNFDLVSDQTGRAISWVL